MTLALIDRALAMLDDMPPYEADEPRVRQLINAVALELERVENTAQDVVTKMFPQNADDTYRTLGLWEKLLGLPVEPAGVAVSLRQAAVVASVRGRQAGSGASWVAVLTQALSTTAWTHQEGPADYTITIRIPYVLGGFHAGQVLVIARRVTPAHLDIAAGFVGGFLIGISDIGDAL
jgi:uncharacterized protein YmfQ (DUF2313 family)